MADMNPRRYKVEELERWKWWSLEASNRHEQQAI
jgi:hypothetical protein